MVLNENKKMILSIIEFEILILPSALLRYTLLPLSIVLLKTHALGHIYWSIASKHLTLYYRGNKSVIMFLFIVF
jgi:hypothetical protein